LNFSSIIILILINKDLFCLNFTTDTLLAGLFEILHNLAGYGNRRPLFGVLKIMQSTGSVMPANRTPNFRIYLSSIHSVMARPVIPMMGIPWEITNGIPNILMKVSSWCRGETPSLISFCQP
jgi:hypothetical protein